jgi:proline iminopeptidase
VEKRPENSFNKREGTKVMFTQNAQKILIPGGEVTLISCIPVDRAKAMRTPLVVVHGGPGGNHDVHKHYLGHLANEHPIYFYDQLGSALSPAVFSSDLIVMDRFVEELRAVLDSQKIGKAIVLGHSWGGAVATDFALTYPERVEGIILSSPLLSTPRWIADQHRHLAMMPQDIQDTVNHHLAAGTTGDLAYQAAEREVYKRHF